MIHFAVLGKSYLLKHVPVPFALVTTLQGKEIEKNYFQDCQISYNGICYSAMYLKWLAMGLQLLSPKPIKVEPSNFDHQTSAGGGQNHSKILEVQSNGAELLVSEEDFK